MDSVSFQKTRKKRVNGFDPPWHRDQVLSASLYLLCTNIHFIVSAAFFSGSVWLGVITVSALLTLTVVASWLRATLTNPEASPAPPGTANSSTSSSMHSEAEHHMPLWCGRTAPRTTRLCWECRKNVLEFDHHCSFLNNCVGSKNYAPFISLLLAGLLQMALQMSLAVVLLIEWERHRHVLAHIVDDWVFHTLLGLEIAASLLLFVGFGVLSCFHFYLYFIVKLGTCDWMLQRRNSKFSQQQESFKTIADRETESDPFHSLNAKQRVEQTQERSSRRRVYESSPASSYKLGSSSRRYSVPQHSEREREREEDASVRSTCSIDNGAAHLKLRTSDVFAKTTTKFSPHGAAPIFPIEDSDNNVRRPPTVQGGDTQLTSGDDVMTDDHVFFQHLIADDSSEHHMDHLNIFSAAALNHV